MCLIAATIEALVERLRRVLESMTADPARRLSSVDVLDEAEYARLDGWGNRAVLTEPGPTAVSIPAVFAAQVARAPEAVALTFEGRSLSYGELDEARTGWRICWPARARARVNRGGAAVHRSTEAIVAILAVLKTGAAYVPIDPAHA